MTHSPIWCDLRKSGMRPTAAPLASSITMCCGCQPVRRVAQPDSSSAKKNACSRKGLSGTPAVEGRSAFQVAAGIEPVVGWMLALKLSSGTCGKEPLENDLVGMDQGGFPLFGRTDGPARHRFAE